MAADGGDSSRDYWLTRTGGEFVTAYKKKRQLYYDAAETKGLRRIWEIAYCQYYGLNPNGLGGGLATQTLAFVGDNNQFLRFRIAEFRSFIKQQISMVLGERVSFKAMGVNTDYTTLAQIQSSDQVINYLYQTGSGDTLEREAAEANYVVGLGGAHVRWDWDGGDEVDVELPHPDGAMVYDFKTGQPIPATITSQMRSGLPMASLHYPWELPCDPAVRGKKHAWRSVRERVCKYELAAQYPEHADALYSMQFMHDDYTAHQLFGYDLASASEDDIMLDHVYVAPCKLLPRGRYLGIAQDTILWDEESPVDGIPIVDMCSARFMGSQFAYCDNWDLIPVQEMRDQMVSDGASNYTKFGRPMIVADEGLQLDQRLLSRGHYIWTKPQNTDAPTAVKIDPMPPGFLEFLSYLHSRDESITQQNSVTRGNPDKNITSGQMAALFHSNSIEFRNVDQAALYSFRKELANMYIEMVRRYAQAPFLAEVSGASERPYLKEVAKESLSGIKRVFIEPVSSLSKSTAGRLMVAEILMKVADPKMRAALQKGIDTGQWGDLCKNDRNSDLRSTWENEQLAKGIPCRVLSTDNPFEHVPAHLADIDARTEQLNENPQAVQAYLDHILDHLNEYQMLNPNLARVLNIPTPLPIQGTPAGQANMLLTGPVQPVPEAGEGASLGDVVEGAAKVTSSPQAQGRDPSGVKLPNPSEPPRGSSVAGAPPPRAA